MTPARRACTRIDLILRGTDPPVSREGVLRAAKLCGLAVAGNLILRAPGKLPLDFYELAHVETAALAAQEARRARAVAL
jgi:hypothetical protein